MSSNPEVSTEDLAGTGAHREPQYGEATERAPDPSMTGAGLGEDRAAAGQGRADAALGAPALDEGGAGHGPADAVTGGPMGSTGTAQEDRARQGMAQPDMAQQGPAQQSPPQQSTERAPGAPDTGTTGDIALLDAAEEQGFRQRWSDVQARFVDDPQAAVQTADALVAELMQSLARGFSEHKGRLESHWRSGGTPDTEDLRQALQRYRSFFDRLLST